MSACVTSMVSGAVVLVKNLKEHLIYIKLLMNFGHNLTIKWWKEMQLFPWTTNKKNKP